jgi:hypothetical protein
LDITWSIKAVIFEFPISESSGIKSDLFFTLKLEAARLSEIFAHTHQLHNAIFQKTDILSSLQVDEGKF